MPSSKRNRILTTSRTTKNRKDLVRRLHASIQECCTTYSHIYVFAVHNSRNNHLKTVRTSFSDSRIIMGKTKVMLVALGRDAENECVKGVSGLGKYVTGEVGLLFTNREKGEVEEFFEAFGERDYARSGTAAEWDVVIGYGEVYTQYGVDGGEDDPLPVQIEPQLRKLGVPTRIRKGKVVLEDAVEEGGMRVEGGGEGEGDGYLVCKKGDVLDSRQTSVLKILGVRMSEFKMELRAVYDKGQGKVSEIGGMEVD